MPVSSSYTKWTGLIFSALALPLLLKDSRADSGSEVVLAQPPAAAVASASAPTGHALDLHNAFVRSAHEINPRVVFFGDSSTFCWMTTGRDIWDKELAPLGALDFGIYGDSAQQLLWCLQNGELDGYQAKAVVVMIGAVNLLHGQSSSSVANAITACVTEIRQRQPQAQVLLFVPPHVSLPFIPNNYEVAALETATILAKLDDGQSIRVIDMTDGLNNRKTEALLQILVNRDAHKSHAEFEVWWDALKKPLEAIFVTVPISLKTAVESKS